MRNLLICSFVLAAAIQANAINHYQFNITPENINQQTFAIEIKTEETDNNVNYQISFSGKGDIPLPTNFYGIVVIAREGRKISDFNVKPVYDNNKATFTISLRKDYVPYAKGRFIYKISDPSAPRETRSVFYNIPLEPFAPKVKKEEETNKEQENEEDNK